MAQSKLMSLVEALANNAVAFIISVLANFAVLPLFGFNVKFGQSVCITIIFTAISIVRTYLVRRGFTWWEGMRKELGESYEPTSDHDADTSSREELGSCASGYFASGDSCNALH